MKIERKPEWLQKKSNQGEQAGMRRLLGELRLNTVCQQALCPNISECFSCGQATFLILGRSCTRLCSFCNVENIGRMVCNPIMLFLFDFFCKTDLIFGYINARNPPSLFG